ncbi:copper chaperone PCu(A)C, partial [Paraburkholderia sp. SIMBA_030]
ELPPNAPTVAAYFVIHNSGKTADRLLSVDSPISAVAELHEHVMQGDLMKMQQVPSVDIPAGGNVMFAPMAYHVMLVNLKDRSLLSDG